MCPRVIDGAMHVQHRSGVAGGNPASSASSAGHFSMHDCAKNTLGGHKPISPAVRFSFGKNDGAELEKTSRCRGRAGRCYAASRGSIELLFTAESHRLCQSISEQLSPVAFWSIDCCWLALSTLRWPVGWPVHFYAFLALVGAGVPSNMTEQASTALYG
jgi:hypothetical protein